MTLIRFKRLRTSPNVRWKAAIHRMPPLHHSLAWVWSEANDVCIRASNAPRRIGLRRAIFQFGTNRNVFLGAHFWPGFRAPNYIWRTLGSLGLMWLCIGASACLQRHNNAAEHESLGVFLPKKTGHRCLTCSFEIKTLRDNRCRCKRPVLALVTVPVAKVVRQGLRAPYRRDWRGWPYAVMERGNYWIPAPLFRRITEG